MTTLEYLENTWTFSINSDFGNGETLEDICIDISHPFVFDNTKQKFDNIEDLITYYYGSLTRQTFYRFESTKGIIIYYKKEFKKLFDGHNLCYFLWKLDYTDIFDMYTNEYIASVESDDIAYISLLTTLYGSRPESNSIVHHRVVPFDFGFSDCIEDFKLLRFDTLSPNKEPRGCTKISYPDDRIIDPSDSIYMIYVSQSLTTISYYCICALVHGLMTGQFDFNRFKGKLFITTGDRGVVIRLNEGLSKYLKVLTKLVITKPEGAKCAEDIVRNFYNSNDKILFKAGK